MKLELVRSTYTVRSTIGVLSYNNSTCFILEDPVRPKKIHGITAIPAGTYQIIVSHSQKFGRDMPLLHNVPGYEGIRIHPGNSPKDTEGCLLPGLVRGIDSVGSSRAAYDALFQAIRRAIRDGERIEITISEGGVSPFMEKELPSPGTAGTLMRVTGDPLNLRDAPSSSTKTVILAELAFGSICSLTGTPPSSDWLHVVTPPGTAAPEGWIHRKYVRVLSPGEPTSTPQVTLIPKAIPVDPALIYRVAGTACLNLRSVPAVLTAATLIASIPAGQRVIKIGGSRKKGWVEVATVLDGTDLRGFVHAAFLENEELLGDSATADLEVSDKALQMILDFEGLDQPSKWPGVMSGISLGHGYDIGYHARDEFEADWGPHLPPDHIKLLATAVGKRGKAAANLASRYTDIRITNAMADAVFTRSTLPNIRKTTIKGFPGVLRLPTDAQGGLGSLVYNRGGSTEGPRRREMLEIRNLCGDCGMSAPDKIAKISDAILSMRRLWPDTRGLRRRREAEAKLIRESI